MLYFTRTDISDRIIVNKTSESILSKGFMFQPNVCNRCHDVLMMS